MSGQPAVLQVVILRDGLLVGTEVYVPGQYHIGSGEGVDLRLDDGTIQPHHATLYFQNGKAAIQDQGGGVFVNGHRVNACEVRSVDEIALGPFSLKARVMAQKPAVKAGPPPEVAMLLGNAPSPVPQPLRAQPGGSPPPPPMKATGAVPSTVVSARRSAAAVQAAPAARAQHLRSVEIEEEPSTVQLTSPVQAPRASAHPPPQPPVSAPAMRSHATPIPAPPPQHVLERHEAPTAQGRGRQPAKVAGRERPVPPPSVPAATEGKGKSQLFFEVYWGELRHVARAFKTIDAKKKLRAAPDEGADLPLYGFGVPESGFVMAEQAGPELYRVFVPKHAAAERRGQDGHFYPVQPDAMEKGSNGGACVTLGKGHALRLTGHGEMTLVAYVQPPLPKPFSNPLKGLPWLLVLIMTAMYAVLAHFVINYTKAREEPDFEGKKINPVAVRLIAPPKPEEKKKLQEKLEKMKPDKKAEKPTKIEKALPKQVTQETKKALKAVEKVAAAGAAMKDLLAAVDKLGSGPGSKKSNMKMSDLLGKQPVAAAGLGSFGLGGGGAGGIGIKGAELLRGKGGGGIGALGVGNIGKGRVGGTVTHAMARSVQAQGTIDKDAVAKVINSHLHEVSSCYERALLKETGLAGKIVLEWNISTAGTVTFAKTKSSTMKSASVEQCILGALKGWKFPPAKGAGVVISYPFMFNSVGY